MPSPECGAGAVVHRGDDHLPNAVTDVGTKKGQATGTERWGADEGMMRLPPILFENIVPSVDGGRCPAKRIVGDVCVVNLGSVSNPTAPDLRASYVMLDALPSGAKIEHRRVAYDHDAFIEAVRRSRHPEAEFILRFQRGKKVGRSPYADQSFVGAA